MQGVTLCFDGLLSLHQREKKEGKAVTAEEVIVSEDFCELLERMWENVLSTEQRKVRINFFFFFLFCCFY